jgi:hypothetical protein
MRLAQKKVRENPVALKGKNIVGPISDETFDLHFGARGEDVDRHEQKIRTDLINAANIPEAALLSYDAQDSLLGKTPRRVHKEAGVTTYPTRFGDEIYIKGEANRRLYEDPTTTEGEAREHEERIGTNEIILINIMYQMFCRVIISI